jgi:uncharacterized membrane protein YqjE
MGARIEGHDRAGPLPRTEHYAGADAFGDGVELRTLLGRLGQDASQLAHDELELVRIEARDIAEAFSNDVKEAGRTMVKDLAKVGVAVSLLFLAGLALTAGAILAIGQLLGAFWAGGLIVGALLLLVAGMFGASAARDLRDSSGLRLEHGRRALQRDREVLRDEARDTGEVAKEGARDFKRAATRGRKDDAHRA